MWFRYPVSKEWILKGLNLKINVNEKVALVGLPENGSSAIGDLIMRFYDACEGTILIDSVNIKEYNVNDLRKMMGYVMKEP